MGTGGGRRDAGEPRARSPADDSAADREADDGSDKATSCQQGSRREGGGEALWRCW